MYNKKELPTKLIVVFELSKKWRQTDV